MVAALSAQEVQGAKFREKVRAAGGLVVGDSSVDQETLRRAGVKAGTKKQDTRPDYIEIDPADGLRELVICERDGTRHVLHPCLTYGAAKKMPFYEGQLKRLQDEIKSCMERDDEQAYMATLERASVAEERMIQLAIPDFPTGLLDRLEPGTLRQLREAGQRMQQQQGDADPNAASRDGQS